MKRIVFIISTVWISISVYAGTVSSKNETCSMIKDDSVDPKGAWAENDLKEWGIAVRNMLREKN